jgi:DNA-binding transcriptional LysR family regulator
MPTDLSFNPPPIEFSHLHRFLAAINELHIGRAADRLGIPEAELSGTLRGLELAVGVPLIARDHRGIAPTHAGRIFAGRAEGLIEGLDRALAEAGRSDHRVPEPCRSGTAATPGAVRIGCRLELPLQRLQSFLGAIYHLDPELQTQVAHLRGPDQLTRLRSGELELGLLENVGLSDGVAAEPVFPGERLVAFLAVGHPLTLNEALRPADLADETLLCVPRAMDPPLSDLVDGLCRDAGLRFRERKEVGAGDVRDLLLAVSERGCVALGTRSAQRAAGEVGSLVVARPVEPALWLPETMLVWRTASKLSLGAALEVARAGARELYASPQ